MREPAPFNLFETVRALESRQEDVLQRLDALNRQIEQVLTEARPPAAPPTTHSLLNPQAPPMVSACRQSPPAKSGAR
jgi:hypothetical protein